MSAHWLSQLATHVPGQPDARAAWDRLSERGLPTRRQEAWKYADFAELADAGLELGAGAAEEGAPFQSLLDDAHTLTLVNGVPTQAPDNAVIKVFPRGELPAALADKLGATLQNAEHPFLDLNAALWQHLVVIQLGKGSVIEQPLVIDHQYTALAEGRLFVPRVLVLAEEASQVQLVEIHRGVPGTAYWSCPVTEIQAAQAAHIHLTRWQSESDAARHVGILSVRPGHDAVVNAALFSEGGKKSRIDAYGYLGETGGHVGFDGLYMATDGQFLDHHTWMTHDCEHSTSRQRFKGVLDGKCETVFDGLVKVEKDAQKTSAEQDNRNLLLSKRGLAHSNPRLEIYADDVKCSHGSSVGELDDDALFYLRSRGVGRRDAQGLLTFAFCNDILDSMPSQVVREALRARVFNRLPGDETVREMAL